MVKEEALEETDQVEELEAEVETAVQAQVAEALAEEPDVAEEAQEDPNALDKQDRRPSFQEVSEPQYIASAHRANLKSLISYQGFHQKEQNLFLEKQACKRIFR